MPNSVPRLQVGQGAPGSGRTRGGVGLRRELGAGLVGRPPVRPRRVERVDPPGLGRRGDRAERPAVHRPVELPAERPVSERPLRYRALDRRPRSVRGGVPDHGGDPDRAAGCRDQSLQGVLDEVLGRDPALRLQEEVAVETPVLPVAREQQAGQGAPATAVRHVAPPHRRVVLGPRQGDVEHAELFPGDLGAGELPPAAGRRRIGPVLAPGQVHAARTVGRVGVDDLAHLGLEAPEHGQAHDRELQSLGLPHGHDLHGLGIRLDPPGHQVGVDLQVGFGLGRVVEHGEQTGHPRHPLGRALVEELGQMVEVGHVPVPVELAEHTRATTPVSAQIEARTSATGPEERASDHADSCSCTAARSSSEARATSPAVHGLNQESA